MPRLRKEVIDLELEEGEVDPQCPLKGCPEDRPLLEDGDAVLDGSLVRWYWCRSCGNEFRARKPVAEEPSLF